MLLLCPACVWGFNERRELPAEPVFPACTLSMGTGRHSRRPTMRTDARCVCLKCHSLKNARQTVGARQQETHNLSHHTFAFQGVVVKAKMIIDVGLNP